jgi:hypothetical protein
MVTWTQIVKALVGIITIATLVFLIHRAGRKNAQRNRQSD